MINTPRALARFLWAIAAGLMALTVFAAASGLAGSPILSAEARTPALILVVLAAVPLAAALLPRVRRADILTGVLALVASQAALRTVAGETGVVGETLAAVVAILLAHWSARVDRFRQQFRHHPDELFEVLAVEEQRRRRGDRQPSASPRGA